jgi:phosphoglucosamine mutase
MGRLFGTDGVRGLANVDLTAELALDLSVAAAHVLGEAGAFEGHRPRAVVGRDPRASGEFLEAAVVAGLASAGVDVVRLGVLPTPAVAYLTGSTGSDLGVMLSASHNPMPDNGIKFLARGGIKLDDVIEDAIEARMGEEWQRPTGASVGRVTDDGQGFETYVSHLVRSAPNRFDGVKVVIDCANGAAYKVGPRILADLGAEIVPIGCSPNGSNINDGCGSTAPELLQLTVPGVRAHVGLALDGDGDRLVMVDHLGRTVDGDQLLYVIAQARKQAGTLEGPVVGTVMTNFGLELAFKAAGIAFHRAQVGDRYVLAMLRETGGTLGGETSGHILCLDKTTTGDGLVSALQVLAIMKQTGRSLAELAAGMHKFPQVLLNVKVAQRFDPTAVPAVQEAVVRVEKRLGGEGRVVLRASGTEPVIRVMVEGRDERVTRASATEIASVVQAAAV